MSRYIDADKLVAWCMETYQVQSTVAGKAYVRALLDAVDSCPTADVVEVVRCKDCKFWQDNNGGYPREECRWGKDETPDANDYCSYGERKENER